MSKPKKRKPTKPPICPYCKAKSRLVDSSAVYGKSYGMMYLCANYPECDSFVGAHLGTNAPLGRLASRELRVARRAAHAIFDPTWQAAGLRRSEAYRMLAEVMGLSKRKCHIAMFDLEQCGRVGAACEEIKLRVVGIGK